MRVRSLLVVVLALLAVAVVVDPLAATAAAAVPYAAVAETLEAADATPLRFGRVIAAWL